MVRILAMRFGFRVVEGHVGAVVGADELDRVSGVVFAIDKLEELVQRAGNKERVGGAHQIEGTVERHN